MTPEDRDNVNAINSLARNQTYVLDPLVDEFEDKILRDGFRPHLPQILQAVQRLCNFTQRVPFTILSKMPDVIDYWEPSVEDKSIDRVVAICLSLRNLVNNGLTEALYVFSGVITDETNAQIGEVVHVRWVCEHDSRHFAFQMADGRAKRIMRMVHSVNSRLSPIFAPWNTNAELFEFLGIPESDHAIWDEFVAHGMEEIRRVFGLLESPESQSEKPEANEENYAE